MTTLNEINFMSKSTSESTTLSDEDLNFVKVEFDSTPTTGSDNLVTSGTVATSLAGKVDTETGKALSTNDFTDSYKTQVETATSTLANVTTEATALSIPRSNTAGKLNAGWIPIATDDTFATGTSTTEVPNVAQVVSGLNNKAEKGVHNPLNIQSSTTSLTIGNEYSLSLSSTTTFVLPTPTSTTVTNTITANLSVIGTPTISWGTSNFFDKTAPNIEEGSYSVIWDYSNSLSAWVCGVISKGTE